MESVTPQSIWNSKQNHPELVVQDCKKAFDLNEEQLDTLRFILMNRGVNKWLKNRWDFIQLKHEIKMLVQERKVDKTLLKIYARMQNIAKSPRYVEWGTYIHKKMSANIKDVRIKGHSC